MAQTRPTIPPDIEDFRDRHWWRDETSSIDTAHDVERFVERVGFAACLADSRRPGPSLYVAICGRRDAVMPRNVQKDPEASQTWRIKDEVVRRGKVYYGKLPRGRTKFLAPRMIPYFHALSGVRKADEPRVLSADARAVLKVLRREWEMATADLRKASGVTDRARLTRAIDELQAAMIVVPADVIYAPFTYIWTLAVARFPDQLRTRIRRADALREIARGFLSSAGLTVPGELARVVGVPRWEAGLANRALVAEGFATMPSRGTYRLAAGLE